MVELCQKMMTVICLLVNLGLIQRWLIVLHYYCIICTKVWWEWDSTVTWQVATFTPPLSTIPEGAHSRSSGRCRGQCSCSVLYGRGRMGLRYALLKAELKSIRRRCSCSCWGWGRGKGGLSSGAVQWVVVKDKIDVVVNWLIGFGMGPSAEC